MPERPPPRLVPQSQLIRACAISLVVWLLLLYFGKNSHYVGDDFTVLRAVFNGGILESLHNYVRPLEYFAAFLSFQTQFPVWLICSGVVYVATAAATLTLSNVVTRDSTADWWRILVCCCSPIAAYPYFQVDTLSQALADFFGTAFAIGVLLALQVSNTRDVKRFSWMLFGLATMSIVSKETSYGIVFAGSCLLLLRHRRLVAAPVAITLLLLIAVMGWSLVANTLDIGPGTHSVKKNLDISAGSHYGLKKNPFYWLFGVIFSVAVTLSPVPTSILLTGTTLQNVVTVCVVVTGAVAVVIAAAPLVRSPGLAALRPTFRSIASLTEPTNAMLVLMLFSVVPSIFFKVSELYASQMLPFVKSLVILVVIRDGRDWLKRLLFPIAITWVMASAVNLVFYTVSSGYNPATDVALSARQRQLYEALADASRHQHTQYSTYSVNMFFHNERQGPCEISVEDPYVCLPPNITSGFPSRIR